jgi:GTP-binding protein HflX
LLTTPIYLGIVFIQMENETTLQRILRRGASAPNDFDGDQLELEERESLRRVPGLSTELEDISEVEYRKLRIERVILIGVWGQGTLTEAENSLRELSALAQTAGAVVLAGVLQRKPMPDPATYFGKGKAEELRNLARELKADTVIANTELSPSQRRALEDVVKIKVIDRTAIILDIFAQHAKSKEGKAQVELAQLEYLLPRLRGWGESMSRQAGGQAAGGVGIGSRGPGETKIELDRRRINTKMAKLRKDIAAMKMARDTKRAKREKSSVPQVAIAGYTNAGKSSLLNRLTRAGVLVENALFATLDPTVRRHETPDGRQYTISDTVGFVRNLPHQLVEAFRSTLEEISASDLVIHVVDATDPDPLGQIATVREVIADAGAGSIPELLVFNKVDLLDVQREVELRGLAPGALMISSRSGQGIDELESRIAELLPKPEIEFLGVIPYSRGDLVSRAHLSGKVLETEYEEQGTRLHAMVSQELAAELNSARQI